MRILYCGMKFDYGAPSRGLSFEHKTFYECLVRMGHEVIYFDFMALMADLGQSAMNRRLVEVARAEKPDLLFAILFGEELDRKAVRTISEEMDTTTFNWFCDDHWRFDRYSRYWAPCFNWVSTTDSAAVAKYGRIGYANVIKTQWACNHFSYHPVSTLKAWDVSFVGQPHGTRRKTIETLRRAGIDVYCRGFGWPEGRVSHEEMLEVFSGSRVNINLSNASWDWRHPLQRRTDQIKGRNFEIPGCGGFLLTQHADNLEEYYVPDAEVGVFRTTEELVEKVRHALRNEGERAVVARSGYDRTMSDHTYEKRLREIFRRMGLRT